MTTKYYVDASGAYLGSFTSAPAYDVIDSTDPENPVTTTVTPAVVPPVGGIEVPTPPQDGRQVWDATGLAWGYPPSTVAELKDHLRETRSVHEAAGILVAGMEIATDPLSQSKVLGVRVAADQDPVFTTNWKANNGWFPLDAAGIVAMSNAVRDYVNAAFAAEASVSAQIDALTVTDKAGVESAFALAV